ncbi:28863_t:CDS:2 [Gigaspora margarita]|uniref:28863_t:CDS:1 n=1 Tax=Gigaspora margarita TaxID=4874 RepID=A0ABN7UVZ4_GIGMA|nr:28863_t:CDS:2 [Gigaspora margarita]
MSISYAIFSLDVLLSIIWKNNLKNAPYEFCVFQGLLLQYMCYVAIACALCFSIHIYHLLVLRKRTTSLTLQKAYYGFIIIYPIVMTCVITGFSLYYKAIKPRTMHCDIVSPSWIRLFANSGSNLLISIPGVYLSGKDPFFYLMELYEINGRSAYVVYKHLNYFKSSTDMNYGSREQIMSNNTKIGYPSIRPLDPSYQQNDSRESNFYSYRENGYLVINPNSFHQRTNDNSISDLNPSYRRTNNDFILNLDTSRQRQYKSLAANRPTTYLAKNNRNYDVTKAAAIRMVLFASLFAFLNLLASTGAVLQIIHKYPIPTNVTSTDWVGGFQGILLFLVFGLPNNWKRFLHIRLNPKLVPEIPETPKP